MAVPTVTKDPIQTVHCNLLNEVRQLGKDQRKRASYCRERCAA
jgi:hypothetical protein